MRKWFKRTIAIGALCFIFTIGCEFTTTGAGSEHEPPPVGISGDNPSVPQEKPEALDPQVDSTEEYLASLTLEERMRAQFFLDEERRNELKLDAHQQLALWLEDAVPNCENFFGTKKCELRVVELEPSKTCGWKWNRSIYPDDVKFDGQYYARLTDEEGYLSGGYEWIASYDHRAYVNGAVLNITQCWNANPSEMNLN